MFKTSDNVFYILSCIIGVRLILIQLLFKFRFLWRVCVCVWCGTASEVLDGYAPDWFLTHAQYTLSYSVIGFIGMFVEY